MVRLVQTVYGTTSLSTWIREAADQVEGLATNVIDTPELASGLAQDFAFKRHDLVRLTSGTIRTAVKTLSTRKAVRTYAEARAKREIAARYAPLALAAKVQHIYDQVRGAAPVHDDNGTVLSGVPARIKRAAIEWYWDCELKHTGRIDGETQNERWVRNALQAYEEDALVLSDDLETAKQQLVEQFDDHVADRCEYLFETPLPNGANQEAARYEMLRARQGLVRRLKTAGTVAAATTDRNNAVTTVDAVVVALSPTWQKVDGDPIASVPPVLADAYTKGRSRWHLDLHAYTGTALDKRESHGAVEVAPLVSDDFEMTDLAGATHGDAKVRIRRKGNGHPAAGTYELKLTARNYEGPTTLTVTVTVT